MWHATHTPRGPPRQRTCNNIWDTAAVASLEFLSLYDSATPTGRARLLDSSASRGPSSFWRRVPITQPPWAEHRPFFALPDAASFPVALAVDLLLLPPVDGVGSRTTCTCEPDRPILPGDRHFSPCTYGMCSPPTCHDPAVRALVAILDAAFGRHRVIAERDDGRRALQQWYETTGAGLRHRPDIVLVDFDGPQSFVIIDVKTCDPAGATHVADRHTDRIRLAAHTHIARHTARTEYGPLPPRFRLVVFGLSIFGSLGPGAQAFIRDVGLRFGGGLPSRLLDESSWAAPRFAPFVRMAVGCAVRRGLAESILRRWSRRPPLPPPPPPPPPPARPPPPAADPAAPNAWPALPAPRVGIPVGGGPPIVFVPIPLAAGAP